MSECCNNPNIKNSTHCDWCTNCGWEYSYLSNEEGFNHKNVESEDKDHE